MPRLFIATLLAASLTWGGAGRAEERVVNVYNWADYFAPGVLDDFTRETGIKVRYDVFDSNEVLETKLLAGKSGYDVVVPAGPPLQREIKAGLFLPLDKAKIPNLKYAWPKVVERLAQLDPGNAHAVNYMWGTTGLGYNAEKVKARLGDQPMNTWDILFKPEILAKLKDCGVYMLDDPAEIIPIAMNYLGLPADSKAAEDIEKAHALLLKIRPYIRKFDIYGYVSALALGEICLAVGWSGDVFQAKTRAVEAAQSAKVEPVQVEYVIPKEGALMWFDSFAIPKDARHVDEALAFINYMMRPEVAAKNTDYVTYASGNLAAQKYIKVSILDNPAIYPSAQMLDRLFVLTSNPPEAERLMIKAWSSFKRDR